MSDGFPSPLLYRINDLLPYMSGLHSPDRVCPDRIPPEPFPIRPNFPKPF